MFVIVTYWYKDAKEVANSKTKEGLIDLPIDAAAWLVNFKKQNAAILARTDVRFYFKLKTKIAFIYFNNNQFHLQLKLSKSYEWSPEDTSLKGSPLTDIINLGIERIKYACDIIDVLFIELKEACTAGRCKVLVAIDGFNAFFAEHTQIKDELKQMVLPPRVTLTHSFLNITKSDWCNGEIVVVADQRATKVNISTALCINYASNNITCLSFVVTQERRESYLPRYLLSEKGFEHLDPFLPVSVENYSQDEFETAIEYYKNRKWIRDITPDGVKEIKLITGGNPYKIIDYCRYL